MSLRDRLSRRQNGPIPAPAPDVAAVVPATDARAAIQRGGASLTSGMYGRKIEEEVLTPIDRVKIDLHRKLVERLDLEALEEINDERIINAEIRAVVTELLREESTPLTLADRENIIEQVLYEITGLGPLEPLFRDLTISDILVNGRKIGGNAQRRLRHAIFQHGSIPLHDMLGQAVQYLRETPADLDEGTTCLTTQGIHCQETILRTMLADVFREAMGVTLTPAGLTRLIRMARPASRHSFAAVLTSILSPALLVE